MHRAGPDSIKKETNYNYQIPVKITALGRTDGGDLTTNPYETIVAEVSASRDRVTTRRASGATLPFLRQRVRSGRSLFTTHRVNGGHARALLPLGPEREYIRNVRCEANVEW